MQCPLGRPFTLALALAALTPAGRAEACPNCKEAVAAQGGEASAMADGYNWSVLFMVSMPFALFATGAWAVGRAARRGALPEL